MFPAKIPILGLLSPILISRVFILKKARKGQILLQEVGNEDDWATSQVFGRDDLPLLAKVSDLAHTWIFVETQNGLGGSDKDRRKLSNESKKDR